MSYYARNTGYPALLVASDYLLGKFPTVADTMVTLRVKDTVIAPLDFAWQVQSLDVCFEPSQLFTSILYSSVEDSLLASGAINGWANDFSVSGLGMIATASAIGAFATSNIANPSELVSIIAASGIAFKSQEPKYVLVEDATRILSSSEWSATSLALDSIGARLYLVDSSMLSSNNSTSSPSYQLD